MGASSNAGAGYRQAAQSVYAAASYNIGVINVNEARQLDNLGRMIPRTISTQQAQAAASGFAIGSKSFLSIYGETETEILREADQVRENAEFERQKTWFEAQSRAMALENQARAAEIAQSAQQASQMQGMFSQITRFAGFK